MNRHTTNSKIVNLTPHNLTIVGEDHRVIAEIPHTGEPARRIEVGTPVTETIDGIPVQGLRYGPIVGLPEPVAGTAFVVSVLVAAGSDRDDLLIPTEVVRDAGGRIIGCRSLARPDRASITVSPDERAR